jgi:hypothetical protein
MPELAHTPYDGSTTPFTLGLQTLDLADWIEPDEHLAGELAEKAELLSARRGEVWQEEIETRPAQAEVLALLAAHLLERFPAVYARDGNGIRVIAAGVTVPLDGAMPPLEAASRLVQEDLVLMRHGANGWRIAAASLCFPSTWVLAEKFGRSMEAIHEPVPGYAERMGPRIGRIFDNLQPGRPVLRYNWSLYDTPALFVPRRGPRRWISEAVDPDANIFIRIERQTLRRLPQSGDILFTIKVLMDPLGAIRRHPDRVSLADSMRRQLLALNADELAYKGLTGTRDKVASALQVIAGPAEAA